MADATYRFSTPVMNQLPYLSSSRLVGQQPVLVPLDQVFSTPPTGSLPVAAPFTLLAGKPPFSYQIQADPTIWTFGPSPIRPAVRAAFDSFLQALDVAGLKGGRLHQVRGWLAQALPQTFAESLYFRYGFDASQRCVELSPGMRLRMDFQSHQAVDPGASSLNGFVGTGRSWLEIGQLSGSQGGLVLGFDPFLSQLQGLAVGTSRDASGGPIDLQGAAYQLPYWRLHYPQTYPSSDSIGFAAAAQNPVLIGAATRAALEAASSRYRDDGTILPPAVGVWFRGRSVVVPEIPVLVQNELRYVTLGSTLRNLFAGFQPIPWASPQVNTGAVLKFLYRLYSPLVGTTAVRWTPLSPYLLVELNATTYANYSDTLDPFDLPLLGGDSITIPPAFS